MTTPQQLNAAVEKWFPWLCALGILLNISALFVTIIEPDGALYAAVAKTMAEKNDFINLFAEGKDWLDKPHFPFWITALSFKIFGVHTYSYKLPALLFWLMGAFYTYKWSNLFYSSAISKIAVLIYLFAAHLIISNNDVRAEPFLTGLMIAGVYHLYKASLQKWSWHLIASCFFVACAMMTKGIFILIPIAGGFVLHWIIKKEWHQFFSVQWYAALLLTMVFLLPELYCLYLQFDLHPEKIVFGKQSVSGIRFFFWDSQFGRFFNNGPIKGKGDPFFFVHTLLWAFLPWSLLLYAAIFSQLKKIIKKQAVPETISLFTALICFLLFSASRFQLPHYMNIVFPFFAVITAQFLVALAGNEKAVKATRITQGIVIVIIVAGTIGLAFITDTITPIWMILWVVICIAALFAASGTGRLFGIIFQSCVASLLVFGFMNLFFYPWLLKYQSGTSVAEYINQSTTKKPVVMWTVYSYSLDFYSKGPVVYAGSGELLNQAGDTPIWLYTSPQQADSLSNAGWQIGPRLLFSHFHITQLSGTFLNPASRSKAIKERVLVEAIRK